MNSAIAFKYPMIAQHKFKNFHKKVILPKVENNVFNIYLLYIQNVSI